MRYYSLILNTSVAEIKENARVNLREYGYDNTFAAVNNYMEKNLKNYHSFCAYRGGEHVIFAVFSFDEKLEEFKAAYGHILGLLNDAFQNCLRRSTKVIFLHSFPRKVQKNRSVLLVSFTL